MTALTISSDGSMVITGDAGGLLALYNVPTGEIDWIRVSGVKHLAFALRVIPGRIWSASGLCRSSHGGLRCEQVDNSAGSTLMVIIRV